MASRTCEYCCEKIHPRAVVCRHCGRDLSPVGPAAPCRFSFWLPLVGLTTATVVGGALLAAEFIKERRNWLD